MPVSPTKVHETVTIAASAAVSGALDLRNESPVGIVVTAAWTAAAITFLGSVDGTTYYPMYDGSGNELSIASGNVVADRLISLGTALIDFLKPAKYLKLRSGVAATPVNQAAARSIIVITRQ